MTTLQAPQSKKRKATQLPRQREKGSSTNNDPHPLRIGPEARVEKVVRNLHVCDVRLEQLEPEPARGEEGGEGEVELAVCEAGVENGLG